MLNDLEIQELKIHWCGFVCFNYYGLQNLFTPEMIVAQARGVFFYLTEDGEWDWKAEGTSKEKSKETQKILNILWDVRIDLKKFMGIPEREDYYWDLRTERGRLERINKLREALTNYKIEDRLYHLED